MPIVFLSSRINSNASLEHDHERDHDLNQNVGGIYCPCCFDRLTVELLGTNRKNKLPCTQFEYLGVPEGKYITEQWRPVLDYFIEVKFGRNI